MFLQIFGLSSITTLKSEAFSFIQSALLAPFSSLSKPINSKEQLANLPKVSLNISGFLGSLLGNFLLS
ncbi:MAG: hypothetical protein MRERV_79c008 [Mycoplasmataceae bacterium RV_VA103A]|nr:MAG: hypothetical protein MRERV_79c008 [Mycoplasmataceae bacterium RV_VA103A]